MKKNMISYTFPYVLLLLISLVSKELVIINQELFIILAFFTVFLQLKKIFSKLLNDLIKEKQNLIRERIITRMQKSLENRKRIASNIIQRFRTINAMNAFITAEVLELIKKTNHLAKKNYIENYIFKVIYNSQKLVETKKSMSKRLALKIFPTFPHLQEEEKSKKK